MAFIRIPKEPPERIKTAAESFAIACHECGWDNTVNLYCCNGKAHLVNGEGGFFENAEGNWYLLLWKG